MPAALFDTGCCPVCGRLVKRLLSRELGSKREIYDCPADGAIEYGPQPVSLLGWMQRITGRTDVVASQAR